MKLEELLNAAGATADAKVVLDRPAHEFKAELFRLLAARPLSVAEIDAIPEELGTLCTDRPELVIPLLSPVEILAADGTTHANTTSDSILKLLLDVDALQLAIVKFIGYILTGLVEASGNNFGVNLHALALRQLRWLEYVVDGGSLAEELLEILRDTEPDVKHDLLGALPEIVPHMHHRTLVESLSTLIDKEPGLLAPLVECLSNLVIPEDLMTEIVSKIASLLGSSAPATVPALVRFLLDHAGELGDAGSTEVAVHHILDHLDVRDIDTTHLVLDEFRAALFRHKLVATTIGRWLDSRAALQPPAPSSMSQLDFHGPTQALTTAANMDDLEFLLLVVIMSTGAAAQKEMARIVRRNIASGRLSPAVVTRVMKRSSVALQGYQPALEALFESLLRRSFAVGRPAGNGAAATSAALTSYGGVSVMSSPTASSLARAPPGVAVAAQILYEAVVRFDLASRQNWLCTLVAQVGSGQGVQIEVALRVLTALAVRHRDLVTPFAMFVRSLRDYLDNLTVAHKRAYFRLLALLTLPSGPGDAQVSPMLEDLYIICHKMIGRTQPSDNVTGALALLAIIERQMHARTLAPWDPEHRLQQVEHTRTAIYQAVEPVMGKPPVLAFLLCSLADLVASGALHEDVIETLNMLATEMFNTAFTPDVAQRLYDELTGAPGSSAAASSSKASGDDSDTEIASASTMWRLNDRGGLELYPKGTPLGHLHPPDAFGHQRMVLPFLHPSCEFLVPILRTLRALLDPLHSTIQDLFGAEVVFTRGYAPAVLAYLRATLNWLADLRSHPHAASSIAEIAGDDRVFGAIARLVECQRMTMEIDACGAADEFGPVVVGAAPPSAESAAAAEKAAGASEKKKPSRPAGPPKPAGALGSGMGAGFGAATVAAAAAHAAGPVPDWLAAVRKQWPLSPAVFLWLPKINDRVQFHRILADFYYWLSNPPATTAAAAGGDDAGEETVIRPSDTAGALTLELGAVIVEGLCRRMVALGQQRDAGDDELVPAPPAPPSFELELEDDHDDDADASTEDGDDKKKKKKGKKPAAAAKKTPRRPAHSGHEDPKPGDTMDLILVVLLHLFGPQTDRALADALLRTLAHTVLALQRGDGDDDDGEAFPAGFADMTDYADPAHLDTILQHVTDLFSTFMTMWSPQTAVLVYQLIVRLVSLHAADDESAAAGDAGGGESMATSAGSTYGGAGSVRTRAGTTTTGATGIAGATAAAAAQVPRRFHGRLCEVAREFLDCKKWTGLDKRPEPLEYFVAQEIAMSDTPMNVLGRYAAYMKEIVRTGMSAEALAQIAANDGDDETQGQDRGEDEAEDEETQVQGDEEGDDEAAARRRRRKKKREAAAAAAAEEDLMSTQELDKCTLLNANTLLPYYRVCLRGLADLFNAIPLRSELSESQDYPFLLRNMAINFRQLIEITKYRDQKPFLRAALAEGTRYLLSFMSRAMPLIEALFAENPVEIADVFSRAQLATRQLNQVCAHTKVLGDRTLMTHVPKCRRALQQYVEGVRRLFAAHGFNRAIKTRTLRHRDLTGNTVMTQVYRGGASDEDDEDDEEERDAMDTDGSDYDDNPRRRRSKASKSGKGKRRDLNGRTARKNPAAAAAGKKGAAGVGARPAGRPSTLADRKKARPPTVSVNDVMYGDEGEVDELDADKEEDHEEEESAQCHDDDEATEEEAEEEEEGAMDEDAGEATEIDIAVDIDELEDVFSQAVVARTSSPPSSSSAAAGKKTRTRKLIDVEDEAAVAMGPPSKRSKPNEAPAKAKANRSVAASSKGKTAAAAAAPAKEKPRASKPSSAGGPRPKSAEYIDNSDTE
ncbi:hypothetical protein H9P43_000243 [Blastocladiella emersonii ATCC 22665]|nr:hypothetical protein H9P43_000243 [Blastocladiella emersonii ATCC 22665]